MPDISRSDSNRSDASRPRVSFNRDVHVKRISGPRTANAYSLSSDGTSFVPTSVRRERPMTKKEMTKEAEVVLRQVDKVSCTATSNLKLDSTDKPKKKKRKDSFSFLKKFDKSVQEKTKNSSSDYDSGSSQEYRIYQVNGPLNNSINNINRINDSERSRKNEKRSYDFMSLDRKKLKKEKRNKNLEYLSLERENDILDKMKKEKPKTLLSAVLERMDGKTKKATTTPTPPPPPASPGEGKDPAKLKPKITLDMPDPAQAKKKPLSPIIESPGVDYFDRKPETAVSKMAKKLAERGVPPKLSVRTGAVGVREPQGETCHNDNKPFSYTSGDKVEAKLDGAIAEGLDSGKEDLKSTSPTDDVIYAQVIVGGRDGNAQKPTVNERVASTEVGRVFVGDESNQSQVGLNYKTESNRDGGVCERVTADGDEMWPSRRDGIGKRERFSEGRGESPARRDHSRDEFTRVIRVGQNGGDPVKRSPTDLHDLSIRREILLSRSESQAKERFNSLKRLQEPVRIRRHASNVNGVWPGDKIAGKNDVRYLGDDVQVNEKFATSLRKIPKDVELIEPTARRKRESKLDAHLREKEKDEKQKNGDKGHVIVTDDDDNLLRKLARIGKSKSFIQEKPKNRKMEKVKMLFMKKKEGKSSESEDDLANRYIEYRGSDVETSDRSTDSSPRRPVYRTQTVPLENSSRRLSTPTTIDSMGTLTRVKNDRNQESHWLKPLDKVPVKKKWKNKADEGSSEITGSSKPTNLRFFGDTDQESTTNDGDLPGLKLKYGAYRGGRASDSEDDPLAVPSRPESRMTDSTLKGSSAGKYKSKYDLDRPDYGLKQMNYGLQMSSNKNEGLASNLSDSSTLRNDSYDINGLKYGAKVQRSLSSLANATKYGNKEKLRNLKSTPTTSLTTPEEPLSRRVKSQGNLYSQEESKRGGRRRLYDSSADSATEGDSSQHSSKSMIYLHAATVGDIPGPRNIYKSERRSQSREELSSIGDSTILAPGKKTLSRSISVLAPWRPKHNREDRILHYDSADYNKGKPPTGMGKNKRSSSRERKHNELRFNTIGKETRRRKDLLR